MMPAGFTGVEATLWLWMVAMIRPGAAFLAAPIFSAPFVPVQLRLVIALAIGIPGLRKRRDFWKIAITMVAAIVLAAALRQ